MSEWSIEPANHSWDHLVNVMDGEECIAYGVMPAAGALIVSDHNTVAALQARVAGLEETERTLRERVWKLRPALKSTIKALRDLHPMFSRHHEGGEIRRLVEIGEKAMTETAGSTQAAVAPHAAPGEEATDGR